MLPIICVMITLLSITQDGIGIASPSYLECPEDKGRYLSDRDNATLVYLLAFGTETVVGVTRRTIEETNDYVIRFSRLWPLEAPCPRYDDHPFVRDLRRILVGTKVNVRIDENSIRVKVQFPEATFFVDEEGIVVKDGTNEFFRMNNQQIKLLEENIRGFAGAVDMKAGSAIRKSGLDR